MSLPTLQPTRTHSETLMVVDDDRLALEFLRDALEEAGYTVEAFLRASEALDRLRAHKFDLLVSDIDMPKMNGIAFLASIREAGLALPVIFLTGNDEIGTAIQAIRLGASDYILKTREVGQTLLLAIDRVLDKVRLERENRRLLETLQIQNTVLEARDQQNMELLERLGRFNDELELRVNQATEELKNANQLLQKGVQELSILYEISQAISSIMDSQALLDLIMNKTKEILKAEASSLMLLSEDASELVFVVAQGRAGASVKRFTVKVGQGISGWVAKTGEDLLIPDAYADPRFDPTFDAKTGFRTRTVMCVPLKVGERIIGVVQLINRIDGGAFVRDDLEMLKAISGQAAIGIENARLYERTRQMADDLRQSLERERWIAIEKEKMGRFIPRDLIDEIHRNRETQLALGGKVIDATVLFSDISGFTSISERVEPTIVIKYLNQYMTEMVRIIESEGGILDKFMGDGIMAVFKEESDRPNHALAAVRAGISMQAKVRELSSVWEAAGLGRLCIRVGVNTGNVLSGNVGAETRMDYTVVGDNVNLAARMESASRPGELLIHETTFARIENLLEPRPRPNEPLMVRGKQHPVVTYLVSAETRVLES
ncbi:MAG: response regulator [Candidatus Riflebacteria bacterium]|nr:response regulator [Candidatus Riflebacteria bacterium]